MRPPCSQARAAPAGSAPPALAWCTPSAPHIRPQWMLEAVPARKSAGAPSVEPGIHMGSESGAGLGAARAQGGFGHHVQARFADRAAATLAFAVMAAVEAPHGV